MNEYQVLKTFAHKATVFAKGKVYDFTSGDKQEQSEFNKLVNAMLQKGYIAKPVKAELKQIKK